MDLKLEVVAVPVADADRAKEFYERLGFRLDVDYVADDGFRVVPFTPPGSHASIVFGTRVTSAEPGSGQGLHLIVGDIEQAHAELVPRGIDVSPVYHDAGGVFHHAGTEARVPGPHPQRRSYGSFASFRPDGNEWVLQEITERIPGR